MAKDPVRVDPNHYKVEINNKHVRVLRIHYGPHEKSVMHGHPGVLGVFLSDGHAGFAYPNGKTEEVSWKAGDAMWFDALEHLPENLSDSSLDLIAVEVKSAGAPQAAKAKPAKAKSASARASRRR